MKKEYKENLTNGCIYISENYPGPKAIDIKPSKELKEYHENSCIQINTDGKTYIKRIGKE